MATTTIHFPDDLLKRIDTAARARGISRNKFLVQASAEALQRESGEWPHGFFERSLSEEDQRLLAQASRELDRATRESRHNRGAAAL